MGLVAESSIRLLKAIEAIGEVLVGLVVWCGACEGLGLGVAVAAADAFGAPLCGVAVAAADAFATSTVAADGLALGVGAAELTPSTRATARAAAAARAGHR